MIFKNLDKNSLEAVTELFTSVFTVSEGEEEGLLLGKLVTELMSEVDDDEIICIGALQEGVLIACIFFTRLGMKNPTSIYMLAPVAVITKHQKQGIGQALIQYGLSALKERDVDVVMTYGDPAFYSKVGFHHIAETIIKAPLTLSMPEGWLGQSLTDSKLASIDEKPTCVEAFNHQAYW